MEYPILPGSVLANDVFAVGQRIAPTHGLDRPNVVERQVQYIDSIPMQRPNAYHQLPLVAQAAVPAQQAVVIRQSMQPMAPGAPTYIPVHVPSTRAKSDRCCTTRMTVVTSVLIICLLIGAAVGVGMYFKYRGNNNTSDDSNKNGAPSSENGAAPSDNGYHDCIWIDFDDIENAVDTIIGGGGKDSNGKDDDRHDADDHDRHDDDDDDDDDGKMNIFIRSEEEDEEKDNDQDENNAESSKKRPGKHSHNGNEGKHDDDNATGRGPHDCFRGLDNGTFMLEEHLGFWIYNSQGNPQYQYNDGTPSWGWGDDGFFTWHGSEDNNLHLC